MKKREVLWPSAALDKTWATLSNGLTILRLILAPIIVGLVYKEFLTAAFVLFLAAAATDFFDGYVARAFNQESTLGALLDPVADKCLIVSFFGALTFLPSPLFHVPFWFFMVIVIREILMILGSVILLRFYKRSHIQPLWWGKITMLFQTVFLVWVFFCYFLKFKAEKIDQSILAFLVIVSLISFYHYAKRAYDDAKTGI